MPKMPDPLLIHIGYHKTATTWMQAQLFTPRHGFRMLADHDEIFARVVQPHGLWFDPAPMQDLIADRSAGLPAGHVPVVSSEILTGHPFHGGQMSDDYARRLHAIAPGAKILVSIRAQLKILPSVYMQYLLRGGTMPCETFFDGTDVPGFFGFRPEHFEYDRLIALYQDLFGAENVYILTQESLAADMEAAAAALAAFAGATAFDGLDPDARGVRGASYPEFAVPVLRRINHVQRSVINPTPPVSFGYTPDGLYRAVGYLVRRPPFPKLFGARKPVTDHVRSRFAGHFAESNARLAALMVRPVDLSRYEMPPEPAGAEAALRTAAQ
ncbi:hypothetical protein HKCCE2091_20730 [Rhodobacterales bacterium HKCCE2091]|nr:hypothetical protein [Rhodobacterales bacterium HKCCE2091]